MFALPELSLGWQRVTRSPACICRQATLCAGTAWGPHIGDTVAVTMLTPETCTTCGGDSVKEHGGGGPACARLAPATPANAVVAATARTTPSRAIPDDRSPTRAVGGVCPTSAVPSARALPQPDARGEICPPSQAAHSPERTRSHRLSVGCAPVGLGRMRILQGHRDGAAEGLRACDLARRAIHIGQRRTQLPFVQCEQM